MRDRFEGCVLGLALADALGAEHEGGFVERMLWRIIGRTRRGERRWTDDTQMSLDVAESLIARRAIDPDDLARRFAASHRWSRGYGPGAARVLKRIKRGADWRDVNTAVFPGGSYGNGGAMRAPIVGLFFAVRPDELVVAARESARVTHAHPDGIEGAVLIAAATAAAATGDDRSTIASAVTGLAEQDEFLRRLERADRWLRDDATPAPLVVARELGNGTIAIESCVTAVYLADRFLRSPFVDLLAFTAACGGDVDTIGAMAGAIWGAANGVAGLPSDLLAKLESRARLSRIATDLNEAMESL